MRAIYYNGRWMTLSEAAAQAPVGSVAVLRWRLNNHWTDTQALMTPVDRSRYPECPVEETLFAQALAAYLLGHPDEARRYQP